MNLMVEFLDSKGIAACWLQADDDSELNGI